MEDSNKYSINEAFLARYFVKQTDDSENELIESWLLQNPQNQKLFNDLQKIWDKSGQFKSNYPQIDIDSAWIKVKNKIQSRKNTQAKVIEMKFEVETRHIPKIWQIAASFIILIGFVWVFYSLFQSPEKVEMQAYSTQNKASELELSDGTKVFLNRNSKLNYPKSFAGKNREIEFSGEAYFEVKVNPQKPFQIKTEHFEVEVLGTAFNLQTSTEANSVIVKEGKVKVSNKKSSLILMAGEKATFDIQTQKLEKSMNENKNFLAYKTRVLVFEQTPLSEVIKQINEVYQSSIVLGTPALENCLLTVTFENQDLNSTILGIITETLDLTIRKENDKIILDGEACR